MGNNDIVCRKQKESVGQWQWKAMKQCWKTTKKTVFVHPIVQSNGTGMVTPLKESLSEKDTKERIPKVASCILWVYHGKIHRTRAQNHSGDQESTCFFKFWVKGWLSSTWQCSKNREAWWKQTSRNIIFDNQDWVREAVPEAKRREFLSLSELVRESTSCFLFQNRFLQSWNNWNS